MKGGTLFQIQSRIWFNRRHWIEQKKLLVRLKHAVACLEAFHKRIGPPIQKPLKIPVKAQKPSGFRKARIFENPNPRRYPKEK